MKKSLHGIRVLCILVALLLVLQVGFPLTTGKSLNAYGLTDGDFDFSVSNGTATLESYNGSKTNLVIPSSVICGDGTFRVTSIGEDCFSQSNLISVTIPNSVTSIGDASFDSCENLTSVTIPSSVTSIGYACFAMCDSLTSITIPNSVKSLGIYCFDYCTKLTHITIPSSITSLSDNCFINCSSLTSIAIPSSVTTIGESCFEGCSSLTSITIPGSVISIGDSCFEDCISLTHIAIPNSVTDLSILCFAGCTNLISVYIPNSVISIGMSCFAGCIKMTSVTIPNSMTILEGDCFSRCSALTKAYFMGKAPGVTYVGDDFLDCASSFAVGYLKGAPGFTNPWQDYPTIGYDYVVQFDSRGGILAPSVLAKNSTTISKPASPMKAGYTFVGWYKDSACTDDWNFSADKATANITLYAKWRVPINSAVSNSYNSIKVSWSGAGSATSYRIYRATSSTGPYALVHTSLSATRSWIDTGRTTGKNYFYKVYPVAGGKTYTFSTYKYSKAIPSTPTATLTKSTATSIKVSWTGVSGATKYQIFRATSSTGTYTYLYTASSTARSWVNTGRTPGKYYYYKVRAYHLEGTTKVYGSCSAVKYIKM
jgi:uncharacterized repeat protein (TIGR02543 family)